MWDGLGLGLLFYLIEVVFTILLCVLSSSFSSSLVVPFQEFLRGFFYFFFGYFSPATIVRRMEGGRKGRRKSAPPAPSPNLSSGDEGDSGSSRNTIKRASKGKWTVEEDEILKKAVMLHKGKNWKKIAEHLDGREDTQCLHRWQKVLNPSLVKGPWTKEVLFLFLFLFLSLSLFLFLFLFLSKLLIL